MNMLHITPLRLCLTPLLAALCILILAPECAVAQDEENENVDKSIVDLSPFVVDGTNISRYGAQSTLAGTRLNSKLKDVSAVVDVYTKEFMEDLGSTDLESVLVYGNNVEKDTEDTIHGLGHKNISTNINFAFRVRGLPASRARNYFVYNFPIDSYNIERLDESRGPNSVLFGFGSPGGIVNMSTKQASIGANFGSLEYIVGDTIDNRIQFDQNLVLMEDKLAFRVNAMHQEEQGWRYLTHDDINAISLAGTFLPFKKTVVRVDVEHFEKDDRVSRPGTYWSRTTTWDAAGQPLLVGSWNDRNNSTLNPDLDSSDIATLSRTNARKYWVLNDNDNDFRNWAVMAQSNLPGFSANRDMQLVPDGILYINTMGEGTGRDLDLDVLTLNLQQEITPNLILEFSMLRHDSKWESRRRGATSFYGDPNVYRPEGGPNSTGPDLDDPEPNPYAGQYYLETFGSNQWWITEEDTTDIRAALAYKLDLKERRLGNHSFAALWERNDYTVHQQNLHEQIRLDGELADTRPSRIENQIVRRHYITDPTNPRDYLLPSLDLMGVPIDIDLPDGTNLTTEWAQYIELPEDFNKVDDIYMIALQSKWFKERLNSIVAYRKDDVEIDDWGSYMPNGDGAYVRNPDNRQLLPFPGTNITYGGVFHITKFLSLFANHSDSIGLPGLKINYAPTGQFMQPTKGVGSDYGVKFSFFENRIVGMVTYYKASSENETDTQNIAGWAVGGANGILDALVDEGLLSQGEADSMRASGIGDTRDSDTSGIEFSIMGRITKNWDFRANYSHTERVTSNIFPHVNAWANNELRPFWATLDRDNPNTPEADNILDTVFNGDSSIQEIIDNFESNLSTRTVTLKKNTGTRPHKFNLFTSYNIDEGPLKGLRLGGGMRYNSANIAGEGSNGETLYGFSHTSYDFFTSYTTQVWGKEMKFQVNIDNAFEDDPSASPAVINSSGSWNSIIVYPPREVTFRVKVKW